MAVSKNFMEWVYEIERGLQYDKVSFVKFDNLNDKKNGKKRKTGFVAVDEKTGKIAKSFCNPSDMYNPFIGRAIAYARLRGIEIPPMETYPLKKCIGKTVRYKNALYYVTSVLAYCGVTKEFYCLRFGQDKSSPTVSQLCEDTEVELI